jgi:VIT1/CCC1 family predicted Fe2+/Mn2+ transporter
MPHIQHSDKNYIHHQTSAFMNYAREVVFGMEDGMVSTLGALIGIAVSSNSRFMTILSGLVIIAVESVSMGIGSYLSSSSSGAINKRKLHEEQQEIKNYPDLEQKELEIFFQEDGWPEKLSTEMAEVAVKDHQLMLREMAYRELRVNPGEHHDFVFNGLYMFFAYIIGGFIPLAAYFLLPIPDAIYVSVGVTLLGLFLLGASTTIFTKQPWIKTGFHMLLLGGTAIVVGYLVGRFASSVGLPNF